VHEADSDEVMEDAVSGDVEEFDDAQEVRIQFQMPQSLSPVPGQKVRRRQGRAVQQAWKVGLCCEHQDASFPA